MTKNNKKSKTMQRDKPLAPTVVRLPFMEVELVKKYGSWVRVQVAFYDFIFQEGTKICADCWKEKAIEEIYSGFSDGEDLYERSVKDIEQAFSTPQQAWDAFKDQVAI